MRPLPGTLRSSGERDRHRRFLAGVVVLILAIAIGAAAYLHGDMLLDFLGYVCGKDDKALYCHPFLYLKSKGSVLGGWMIYLIAIVVLLAAVYYAAQWLQELFKTVFSTATGLGSFLGNPSAQASAGSVNAVRRDIEKLVGRQTSKGNRLVIFIDDLERCSPRKAIELLEAAHQLLAVPGVVLVVMADLSHLAASAEIKYANLIAKHYDPIARDRTETQNDEVARLGFGRVFLQKMIQLSFELPTLSAVQVAALLRGPGNAPGLLAVRVLGPAAAGHAKISFRPLNEEALAAIANAMPTGGEIVAAFLGIGGLIAAGLGSYLGWNELAGGGAAAIAVAVSGRPLFELLEAQLRRMMDRSLAKRALASGTASTGVLQGIVNIDPSAVMQAYLQERKQKSLRDQPENPVELAEGAAQEFLPALPRSVKRTRNRIRLNLFIAHWRGLLGGIDSITPQQIGKWVALTERWPEVALRLRRDHALLARLEVNAREDSLLEKELPAHIARDRDFQRWLAAAPVLADAAPMLILYARTYSRFVRAA